MRTYFFLLLPLFFFVAPALPANAQEDSVRQQKDNFWIYPNKFAIRLVYQQRKLPLTLSPVLGEQKVVYQPNSSRTFGLGGSLFGISFTVSFPLPQSLQRDPNLYGSTTQRDLRLNAFLNRFGLQVDRQDYQGYFLDNIQELDPDWQGGEEYPLRTDLRVRRLGAGISYLLKPERFSYSQALNNKRRQREGGGTFFFQIYGGRLWVEADSVLMPRRYFANTLDLDPIDEIKVHHASLMAGYAHTFVLGRFYMMASLALGPEIQRHSLGGENQLFTDRWAAEGRLQLQTAFGYDDDTYFWNIAYNSQRQQYELNGLGVSVNTNGVRLLVGRRFQEFKFMHRFRQWDVYQRIRGNE